MTNSLQHLLIISSVWPEPTSSAAGTRMMQLINSFKEQNFKITYATTASHSEHSYPLENLKIDSHIIKVNDSNFDHFIQTIQPSIVLFDRFMMEEQFGWRVSENCPETIKVLDTEDLHFLRFARNNSLKNSNQTLNLYNEITKREIASILRCDLSIIISEFEMELLIKTFNINPEILIYTPYLVDCKLIEKSSKLKTFTKRNDFVFIGNFIHEPNWKTVLFLKEQIWPILSHKLKDAELHIWGAYPSEKVFQLNNPKERFYIKGRAENAIETISNYKLLIAPIQSGAGLKGKFIDAMLCQTPSVTTTLGSEGINNDFAWPGEIQNETSPFIEACVNLFTNEKKWIEAQEKCFPLLKIRFDKEKYSKLLVDKIYNLQSNLKMHRENNFLGQILQHHTLQSTKYMSKWIEEKNK